MMGTKQFKLKPVQPLNTDNFAELMRKFGARPVDSDVVVPDEVLDPIPISSSENLENKVPDNRRFYENMLPDNNISPENRAPDNSIFPENRTPDNRTLLENRAPDISIFPENRTPDNRTLPENRAPDNDSACLVRMVGFTAFGVLASLKDCFSQGHGTINIVRFASLHGISRSALTVQLRILEQNGLIQLGPIERRGRRINIPCIDNGNWCPVFSKYPENRTDNYSSSSSYYYKQQQLIKINPGNGLPRNRSPENELPENRSPESGLPGNSPPENEVPGNRLPENEVPENELPGNRSPENELPENRSLKDGLPENTLPGSLPIGLTLVTPISEGTYAEEKNDEKVTFLPSWKKAQMRDQAEELFYIGLIAKIAPEILSMQTLTLYSKIVSEHNKDWAAALFLILLPKAKDNPTGYILSAYRNGAEPTSASIIQVRDMWKPLESIGRLSTSQPLKERIREAVEKEDVEAVASLTQIQALVKVALQLLSWTSTLDQLLKRRDVFIDSLFSLK
jgi:hypothetical protein